VDGIQRFDTREVQAYMSRGVSRRMQHVNTAAVRQALSSSNDMFDIMTCSLLYRRHIQLMRHDPELERFLELLEPAGVISVTVGEDTQLEILMFMIHVFDGIHDDIGVGIRESRIHQDQPIVAGDQKRFDDSTRTVDAARNDLDVLDRNIFYDADHRCSFILGSWLLYL